jgi:hypothetical protein
MFGSVLYQSATVSHQTTFDVLGLLKGIYSVKLLNKKQVITVRKIVVQ